MNHSSVLISKNRILRRSRNGFLPSPAAPAFGSLLLLLLCLGFSAQGQEETKSPGTDSLSSPPIRSHSKVGGPGGDLSSSPRPSSAKERTNVSYDGVEQAPIDIYLKDQGGNLIFLPNFPLENLDEIYRSKNHQDDVPDYVLQLLAEGKVEKGYARIQLHFRLFAQDKPTLVIPLRMPEGVLQLPTEEPSELSELVEYRGPGKCRLFFDQNQGGYVCRIRQKELSSTEAPAPLGETSEEAEAESSLSDDPEPPADDSSDEAAEAPDEADTTDDDFAPQPTEAAQTDGQYHEIIFELCFPVKSVGEEESHLTLTFPHAISSELKLEVPLPDAIAEVNRGVILQTQSHLSSAHTMFTISGVQDRFEFQWRKSQTARNEVHTMLQVKDAIITAILSNREANFEAVLPVQSYGGTFDHFRVRLPSGASWIPENYDDYSVHEITKNGDAGQGSILEVRLPEKTDQTVYVHLKARGALPPENPGGWYELGGFEVLEAKKQYGKIAVGTLDDWRLQWKIVRGVRVDDLRHEDFPEEHLPESFLEDQLTAGFEYYSQPCSLKAQVVLRQTNINVKPEYQISINKGQITLEGRLTYQVHGAETNQMIIDMPGWLSPEVGPANIVDLDASSSLDDSGRLTVPLLVPSKGTIQIDLKAYRKMDPESETIRLEMPRPEADWFGPASIAILPADNVELTPETENIQGMTRKVRKSLPLELELPERQNAPLFYQQESQDATFVANITFHRQQIDVASKAEVRMNMGREQILQTLTYNIAYEPIDRLTLLVPKELDESGHWQVSLDSLPLTPQSIPGNASLQEGTSPQTDYVRKRISLRQARIGSCVLSIRSSFDPIELQPEMTIPVHVPLIMPEEGTLTENEVAAVVPPGVNVQLIGGSDEPWKPQKEQFSENNPGSSGSRVFVSEKRQFDIPLGVYLADRDVLGVTGVQRAWIQSWFLGPDRVDRVVYRLTTDRANLRVQLPSGVDLRKITGTLDGQPLDSSEIDSENILTIPFPPFTQQSEHLLEIWYQVPDQSIHRSPFRVELPRLLDDTWVRRMYWQVILPKYHHLAGFSENLTSEFQWGWKGAFWGRVPGMSQEELEAWVGAEKMDPVPQGTSRYLFSSMGAIEQPELRLVQRSTIVLVVSSIALILGLLIIYFPALRYPGILFVLGILLVAAIAFRPAPALLVAQASGIGIFMALLGGYLFRIFSRKERWGKVLESVPTESSYGSRKIPIDSSDVEEDASDPSGAPNAPYERVHSTVSNYDDAEPPPHYET